MSNKVSKSQILLLGSNSGLAAGVEKLKDRDSSKPMKVLLFLKRVCGVTTDPRTRLMLTTYRAAGTPAEGATEALSEYSETQNIPEERWREYVQATFKDITDSDTGATIARKLRAAVLRPSDLGRHESISTYVRRVKA